MEKTCAKNFSAGNFLNGEKLSEPTKEFLRYQNMRVPRIKTDIIDVTRMKYFILEQDKQFPWNPIEANFLALEHMKNSDLGIVDWLNSAQGEILETSEPILLCDQGPIWYSLNEPTLGFGSGTTAFVLPLDPKLYLIGYIPKIFKTDFFVGNKKISWLSFPLDYIPKDPSILNSDVLIFSDRASYGQEIQLEYIDYLFKEKILNELSGRYDKTKISTISTFREAYSKNGSLEFYDLIPNLTFSGRFGKFLSLESYQILINNFGENHILQSIIKAYNLQKTSTEVLQKGLNKAISENKRVVLKGGFPYLIEE